ncbi:MAG TPA: PilZ domain-containing protein [Burkholderiales bacterium]|nr:PilZ domain-containing protein [Burkholderiales bacterium]
MSEIDPTELTLAPGVVSTSGDEVERVLSVLMIRREPLAALLADGDASRWTLRLVDPGRHHIVVAPVSGSRDVLLRNREVTFLAEFGGMNIEFTAAGPQAVTHEGAQAVRLEFPAVTVSRQRRAHPRAQVPEEAPLHCAIPAGAGVALEGQIMDVSEGGLGLLIRSSYLVPAPETLIRGWRIERPGHDVVTVDLQVRHCRPVVLADGSQAHRWGCQFVNPSEEARKLFALLAGA